MKKSKFIKIIFIALVLFAVFFYTVKVNAIDTGYYNVGTLSRTDAPTLFGMGDEVLGTLMNIATIVSILTIAIIGVKYMYGSLEQKAEYKASLLPWLIGAIIVFSITRIIELFQMIASNID